MADSFTTNLVLRKPEIGHADNVWGAGLNGDLDLIDAIFAPAGTGTPIGWKLGAGMVGDARLGTLRVTAERLTLFDQVDPAKQVYFTLSNLPAGASRNYGFPPVNDVLVGVTATQTLANKLAVDPVPAADTQAIVSAHWVNAAVAAKVDAAIAAALVGYTKFNTGDILASAAGVKDGWVPLAGGKIGNTGATGTIRSNPDCLALYTLFWNLGAPFITGKGDTAAGDFNLLKTVTLPDSKGRALIGLGGDINLLTLFNMTGTKDVTLTVAQLAKHKHGLIPREGNSTGSTGAGNVRGGAWLGGTPDSSGTNPGKDDSGETGGDAAHANVQPSIGIVFWIKL